MSDETGSPAGGEAYSVTELPADAPETFNSASEAAAYFTSLKAPKPEKESPAESADPATAETELSPKDNADLETDPGEEPDAAEPDDSPPIEPPRSWTKAEKERFQSLPRETQEYLHTREQEREREFRRSQNEIAEDRKAAKAEREAADKVRQQYEAKVKEAERSLLDSQNDRFPDIKSMDDIERLSRAARELSSTDPFKALEIQTYLSDFNTHQQRLQLMTRDAQQAEARQSQEHQTQWAEHVQKENALAAEYIPELADKDKGLALTKRVASELLPELGFKDSELNALASGKQKLSIYDHRVQRLLADSLKLRDIQSAPKAVAAKPLPPVQRPGTSKPSGSVASERVQALNRKPELTVKEATELYELQSRSSRRAQ